MTTYSEHTRRWKHCKRCELSECRSRVVLARGIVPADVVMVGEAPGSSEDSLGKPFCGPAGKLLDRIIKDAGWNLADADIEPVRYALTNLVACIPLGEDGDKVAAPPDKAIEACAPRLREFVELCAPKAIVGVGTLADKWIPRVFKDAEFEGNVGRGSSRATSRSGSARRRILSGLRPKGVGGSAAANPARRYRLYSITHPAAILRLDVSQQGLAYQKCVLTLQDVADDLCGEATAKLRAELRKER